MCPQTAALIGGIRCHDLSSDDNSRRASFNAMRLSSTSASFRWISSRTWLQGAPPDLLMPTTVRMSLTLKPIALALTMNRTRSTASAPYMR